jgi:hypothetical protein
VGVAIGVAVTTVMGGDTGTGGAGTVERAEPGGRATASSMMCSVSRMASAVEVRMMRLPWKRVSSTVMSDATMTASASAMAAASSGVRRHPAQRLGRHDRVGDSRRAGGDGYQFRHGRPFLVSRCSGTGQGMNDHVGHQRFHPRR